MASLIAFCGIDCARCPTYVATQTNDLAAQERILAEWRVQFNLPPTVGLEAVTCDGCTSTARLGGYCGECPVRACGVAHGVANCAHCADYSCDTLNGFFAHAPAEVRATLDEIRRTLM
jgi:hypothetical protein